MAGYKRPGMVSYLWLHIPRLRYGQHLSLDPGQIIIIKIRLKLWHTFHWHWLDLSINKNDWSNEVDSAVFWRLEDQWIYDKLRALEIYPPRELNKYFVKMISHFLRRNWFLYFLMVIRITRGTSSINQSVCDISRFIVSLNNTLNFSWNDFTVKWTNFSIIPPPYIALCLKLF